jgi:NSS family neurotransmitter:Na+ symporter
MKREQWGTRVGFILAAVGSAIGLGNIWRFPYITYENGGGAFLIPYFFAMLTAGIPFMILEFGVGHKGKGSAPGIFASLSQKWEWLGWWQIVVSFTISVYYVAVVAWSIVYCWLSFSQGWGDNTGDFFFKSFLHLSGSPTEVGNIQWPIFGAIIFSWFVCWIFLYRGVRTGIEWQARFSCPSFSSWSSCSWEEPFFFRGPAPVLTGFSNLIFPESWITRCGQRPTVRFSTP